MGGTWTPRDAPEIVDLAVNPEDTDHVVASTSRGAMSSKDAGRHWRMRNHAPGLPARMARAPLAAVADSAAAGANPPANRRARPTRAGRPPQDRTLRVRTGGNGPAPGGAPSTPRRPTMARRFTPRTLTEAARDARRHADRDRLEQAARDLLTSEGWQRWIRVRATNGLARYTPII